MKKRFLITLSILLSFTFLKAQKYSNEFLSIGAGARAHGMGNSVVASSKDAYSPYWNPSGIAGGETDLELGLMHAQWFAGIGKYDFASLLYTLKPSKKGNKRAIGVSMVRFGIDDIPNTLSLYESDGTINYDNIVPFSAVDYAFMMTFARSYWVGEQGELYFGANAKMIYRKIGPFAKAMGFGFDLGMQYHHKKHFSFGFTAHDVTNTFNAWNFSFTDEEKEILSITNNEIPISSVEITRPWFTVGANYRTTGSTIGFLTEVNLTMNTDGKRNTLISSDNLSFNPYWGMELDYDQKVFIRGGVYNFQQELNFDGNKKWTMQPTLGIGLKLYTLKLDYAFNNINGTEQGNYSHVISLNLGIDYEKLKRTIKENK